MSSTNYVKFGPQEMIVQFASDRGELKSNDNGEYFLRTFSDGRRFTCASPELERRLVDLEYRAGEQVGITRQTRNRNVMWKVRLIEPAPPVATAQQPSTIRPAVRPVPMRTPPAIPAAIPESKYAAVAPTKDAPPHQTNGKTPPPHQSTDTVSRFAGTTAQQRTKEVPPVAWPETETPAKPVARAQTNNSKPEPDPPASVTPGAFSSGDGDLMARCLCGALNASKIAQSHAAAIGFPTLFGPGEIERMAVSMFIQRVQYGSVTDRSSARNGDHRANGTTEAWRH